MKLLPLRGALLPLVLPLGCAGASLAQRSPFSRPRFSDSERQSRVNEADSSGAAKTVAAEVFAGATNAADSLMVHRDLVVEVDLGPFKHIKDEGLPLRKAALAALETMAGTAALVDCLPTEAMPFLLAALVS